MKPRAMLSKQRVLLGLLLASVVAAGLGGRVAAALRELVRPALAPVGDGGIYLTTAVKSRLSEAGQATISQDRARRLELENERLHAQLGQLVRLLLVKDQQVKDIQGIRNRLYGPTRDMPGELIPARVVAQDSLPYSDTRILAVPVSRADKGSLVTTRRVLTGRSKALPPKRAVMTAEYLVGRLSETGAFTARLQLLTDRSFKIPVLIRRRVTSGKPRMITTTDAAPSEVRLTYKNADVPDIMAARGDGAGGMEIRHVKALHAVKVGDWILSCDSDASIGTEVPVGEVSRVLDDTDKPGLFVTLRVRPYADMATLRDVYIIEPPMSEFSDSDSREDR